MPLLNISIPSFDYFLIFSSYESIYAFDISIGYQSATVKAAVRLAAAMSRRSHRVIPALITHIDIIILIFSRLKSIYSRVYLYIYYIVEIIRLHYLLSFISLLFSIITFTLHLYYYATSYHHNVGYCLFITDSAKAILLYSFDRWLSYTFSL